MRRLIRGNIKQGGGSTLFQAGNCPSQGDRLNHPKGKP
jgi:hypothetical protein